MKKNFFLVIVSVVVLCLFGWTAYARGQKNGSAGQAWEYLVEPPPENILRTQQSAAIQQMLNQRAAQGWELVAVTSYFYFKRPK